MKQEAAREGWVCWFTGLSGSGKTTTALALTDALRKDQQKVELLDGDELRAIIGSGLGFSREDRMENIRRIVYVAKLLSCNGITVVVSTISPYHEMRRYARKELQQFVEIYVDCPLEECERRDPKGLYVKARQYQIEHFTGITDVYEPPEQAEITINSISQTPEANAAIIKSWLHRNRTITETERRIKE